MRPTVFLFDPAFLKIVIIVAGIVVAIYGLTFLTQRRRTEILEHYFTPDEEGLEEDFFRRRAQRQNAAQAQQEQTEADAQDALTTADEWGDAPEIKP